jgi:hypothetical protein
VPVLVAALADARKTDGVDLAETARTLFRLFYQVEIRHPIPSSKNR